MGPAVPFLYYVEPVDSVAPGLAGTEEKPDARLITETTLPLDCRVWLPGLSPADLLLGKRPQRRLAFYEPEAVGVVDHWEVTL